MKLTLRDGSAIECDDSPFASGSDGAAHWSRDSRSLVKLYHRPEPWRLASLEAIIGRFNVVRDEPYWAELLCWPTGIVITPKLGVVLPRAGVGLKKFSSFILLNWLKYHPEDYGNFQGRLGIAVKLARAIRLLHFGGLCHSDLSENNFLANSTDGRAYVIDLDSLVVPNLPIAKPVVFGSPGVMAPELVTGTATTPAVETDRHSLAVLLYQLLLFRHPLLGRLQHSSDGDENVHLQLGERALYVEHPTNPANRPTYLPHQVSLLGRAVEQLFHRAFVDGVHRPGQRPTPADWERAFVHLGDMLVTCLNPRCTLKSFPLVLHGRPVACPWCQTPLRGITLPLMRWLDPVPGQPGHYRATGISKVCWPDGGLHLWHIMPNLLPGPAIDPQPLAHFSRVRDQQGTFRWLVINERLPHLEAADPGDRWRAIRVNEAVELKQGRKLRFGAPGFARDALVEMVEFP